MGTDLLFFSLTRSPLLEPDARAYSVTQNPNENAIDEKYNRADNEESNEGKQHVLLEKSSGFWSCAQGECVVLKSA